MARALELHNYGPGFLKFFARTVLNQEVLHTASVSDVRVVVDIGAFDGAWAKAVSGRYPGSRVYSFEPDPSALLKARASLAECANVRLFPYGLGATTGTYPFLQCGPGSTTYPGAHGRLEPTPTELPLIEVPIRDVKDVFDELALAEVDFLKINTEGSEFDLLERLIATRYIERCRSLLIQFHEWIPDAYKRRRRIHAGLRRTHHLDWSDYFVWESWTRK